MNGRESQVGRIALPVQTAIVRDRPAQPLVEVSRLGVKYSSGTKQDDLQSLVYNTMFKRTGEQEEHWALHDVEFTAEAGEIVGIVGANGAGKTTLCKVLAGLLRPDTGHVQVNGLVSALLAIGVGFNGELSGRENIYLNGMMLGMARKELTALLPAIIELAGLKQFIDQSVKVYSTGMRARLGFSIAAMIEPEVLILDEVLGVGDLAFRARAGEKMRELVQKAKMVIVVTHQIAFVEQFCSRAMWLDKGTVRQAGSPTQIVSAYKASLSKGTAKKPTVVFRETQVQARSTPVVLANQLGVRFTLRNEHKKPFWVFSNISFQIKEGEIVGLIGPNGAGKTTLCRVLSGILQPDHGQVTIAGEVSALLTLGTGFNGQLSGHDNIYLNGMMLGMSKRRVAALYPEIVEFSGLAKSLSLPLKHYSLGMKMRLGFSIAAMIKPDIFIIDEALGAGDLTFYEKASAKIQESIESAKAVMVVTHNMEFVEQVCTRAVWLDKGEIQFDGDCREAVARYRESAKR